MNHDDRFEPVEPPDASVAPRFSHGLFRRLTHPTVTRVEPEQPVGARAMPATIRRLFTAQALSSRYTSASGPASGETLIFARRATGVASDEETDAVWPSGASFVRTSALEPRVGDRPDALSIGLPAEVTTGVVNRHHPIDPEAAPVSRRDLPAGRDLVQRLLMPGVVGSTTASRLLSRSALVATTNSFLQKRLMSRSVASAGAEASERSTAVAKPIAGPMADPTPAGEPASLPGSIVTAPRTSDHAAGAGTSLGGAIVAGPWTSDAKHAGSASPLPVVKATRADGQIRRAPLERERRDGPTMAAGRRSQAPPRADQSPSPGALETRIEMPIRRAINGRRAEDRHATGDQVLLPTPESERTPSERLPDGALGGPPEPVESAGLPKGAVAVSVDAGADLMGSAPGFVWRTPRARDEGPRVSNPARFETRRISSSSSTTHAPIARAEHVLRSVDSASTAAVPSFGDAPVVQAEPLGSPSAEGTPLDLERLTEQVTRIIVRRLEVERERRGDRRY